MDNLDQRQEYPRGIQHVTYYGLFFIAAFGVFGYPFWYFMRDVLPRTVSLSNESVWFSPVVTDGTRVDYAGFLVPLLVSLIALSAYAGTVKTKSPLPRSLKLLVLIVPVSFLISQFTVLGIFASLGLTDPISFIALTIAAYTVALRMPTTEAALLGYPLGFAVGLLSDLESLSSFHGVFGGYGLGDGDFVYPLSFLIGTIVLSLAWRRIFEGIRRLEHWADEWMTHPARPWRQIRGR